MWCQIAKKWWILLFPVTFFLSHLLHSLFFSWKFFVKIQRMNAANSKILRFYAERSTLFGMRNFHYSQYAVVAKKYPNLQLLKMKVKTFCCFSEIAPWTRQKSYKLQINNEGVHEVIFYFHGYLGCRMWMHFSFNQMPPHDFLSFPTISLKLMKLHTLR